jgi:hypothetical protein
MHRDSTHTPTRYDRKTRGADKRQTMSNLDSSYKWVRGKNEPLEDSLEKQIHYWMQAAGVRMFY